MSNRPKNKIILPCSTKSHAVTARFVEVDEASRKSP